ncbi:MAG: YraN family protein, partial [Bacteroidales bacterium]|nr:YraN family protein [Bacteroidales bacterium]
MSDRAGIGVRGEELAAGYLRQKGYTIRDRNWRSGRTEIDIIAEDGETVVFIEVKARSSDYQVHPRDAVSVPKQRTIIYAASNYIDQYNLNKDARFDIITVIFSGSDITIDHIENAYYPTL